MRVVDVRQRVVLSGTTELAVYERGDPSWPTVVLVHGWPDSAAVWDLVADRLATDHHVVTFDARGVGRSSPATGGRPYAIEYLADDIDAVVSATRGGERVRLVGHDWGSVAAWEYVMRPEAAEKVACFTSVSGPNLDYVGQLMRDRRWTWATAAQALRSLYTVVLSTPLVRTGIWRVGFDRVFRAWVQRSEGIEGYPGAEVAHDAIALVAVYRTNLWRKMRRPHPRPAQVPVRVVVATGDRYVGDELATHIGRWVSDLTVERIDAGHWSLRSRPEAVAALIAS